MCQQNTVLGIPRTEILNTAMHGPITVGDILQVTANTPNDLDGFWPDSDEERLKWLAKNGLIANTQTCPDPQCGPNRAMHLVQDVHDIDKYIVSHAHPILHIAQYSIQYFSSYMLQWRCNNCRKGQRTTTKKIRAGTFFERSHLTFTQILKLAIVWATLPRSSIAVIRHQIGPNSKGQLLSHTTIVDFYNFFREICQVWYDRFFKSLLGTIEIESSTSLLFRCEDHAQIRKLGGQNRVVEIDESLIYHPKYHRGRARVQGTFFERDHSFVKFKLQPLGWVFGMVERGTPNVIVVPVAQRNANTLLPIIQDNIEDNTIIMSDMWAAYFRIGQLPNNYQHFAVNHQVI